MDQASQTEIIEQDGVIVIKPPQRFDVASHNPFLKTLDQLPHAPRYLVDLTATDYVDSAGLGMLLLLRQRLSCETNSLELHIMPGQVQQTLSISKFDQLFSMVRHEQPIAQQPNFFLEPATQGA
ncbi:STAS domain-containing protein [Magnetococcus sp. PR-3]|uniref:STAS domain-containing protein n=1 Tax=Magnetococcus sp. PR-3 TaxID=3120355 RepID=UPI002FCDF74C